MGKPIVPIKEYPWNHPVPRAGDKYEGKMVKDVLMPDGVFSTYIYVGYTDGTSDRFHPPAPFVSTLIGPTANSSSDSSRSSDSSSSNVLPERPYPSRRRSSSRTELTHSERQRAKASRKKNKKNHRKPRQSRQSRRS